LKYFFYMACALFGCVYFKSYFGHRTHIKMLI